MLSSKSEIYAILESEFEKYKILVPERVISSICAKIKMSEEGIKKVIDKYKGIKEHAKKLKYSDIKDMENYLAYLRNLEEENSGDIRRINEEIEKTKGKIEVYYKIKREIENVKATILKLISDIAVKEGLQIITYEEYLSNKSKAARENLAIGQSGEQPGNSVQNDSSEHIGLGTPDKGIDPDKYNGWLEEQFRGIGETSPESATGPKTVIVPKTATAQKPNYSKSFENQRKPKPGNIASKSGANAIDITESDLNNIDEFIINKLILSGRTLKQVFLGGEPIDENSVISRILKTRIIEIGQKLHNIKRSFRMIKSDDIEKVLKWVLGEKIGVKYRFEQDDYCKGNLDSIRNIYFKDSVGDYETCSMVFLIENIGLTKCGILSVPARKYYEGIKMNVKVALQDAVKFANEPTKNEEIR